MQRPKVVLPKGDGGAEVYPMTEWLRANPRQLPAGYDATGKTSHQLRGMLLKRGWTMKQSPEEVVLLPPDADADASAVVGIISEETSESETQDADEDLTFALEAQLRDFIASNLRAINISGHKLSLFQDNTGRKGIEYPTEVGIIDILATDEHGALYVFELKREIGPDRTMGQIARYMGWLKHQYGSERGVHGVIVAKSVDQRLKYAALAVPNVHLFEYRVRFELVKAAVGV